MAEELHDAGRGVTICCERFGDPSDPPLLLVMGLGMPMLAWPDPFVAQLVARGLHVIRFDNRDAGRSSFCDDVPYPTLRQLALRRFDRRQYRLSDMAADARGLIDALDLGSVHVVGVSMGGMIAQTLAIEHPRAVRSLTSMLSNTGSRRVGQQALEAYPVLLRRAPRDRDGFIAHQIATQRVIGSPGGLHDGPELRALLERAWDRCERPAATPRQLAAILASGDRTAALRRLQLPALVIHGTADRLVSPSGGRATARAIPGARLLTIDGMRHDLPPWAWPRMSEAIADHVLAAEHDRRAPAPA